VQTTEQVVTVYALVKYACWKVDPASSVTHTSTGYNKIFCKEYAGRRLCRWQDIHAVKHNVIWACSFDVSRGNTVTVWNGHRVVVGCR